MGGVEVSPPHKYPWMVGIRTLWDSKYWCGGAIINDRYVLTAAHCFYSTDGILLSTDGMVVGVADHDMTSNEDDVEGATRFVEADVIIHPNYDFISNANDIALLKMKENLDLSKYKEVRPVCLPTDSSKSYTGYMGSVYGWGLLSSTGQQPPVLMETHVSILDPSCGKGTVAGIDVTPDMLCAGHDEGGKDACRGDSGGPLSVEEGGTYTQVGLVSFGVKCSDSKSPGVYTRVSSFLPWIRENTADAIYC
ncbi:venom protease-like [Panulirus ornatus]|uniref:venom protease-like n=1 Tax=Panulirus ornatus TaxID=150431 RepID=UPI003A893FD5